MFEEMGHTVALYDYFYANDPFVLHHLYDFITATEVVEHLHNPAAILSQLWSLLKPSGHLGLMTKLIPEQESFANWHYKNDPTHVCFFSRNTFKWLARHWQTEVKFLGNDVILFSKPESPQAD